MKLILRGIGRIQEEFKSEITVSILLIFIEQIVMHIVTIRASFS